MASNDYAASINTIIDAWSQERVREELRKILLNDPALGRPFLKAAPKTKTTLSALETQYQCAVIDLISDYQSGLDGFDDEGNYRHDWND